MVWVRSEYAEELAVVFAWLSAAVPWSVTYGTLGEAAVVILRFPMVGLQYTFGLPFARAFIVQNPVGRRASAASVGSSGLRQAHEVWLVGLAVLAVAVLLSLLLYVEWDGLAERDFDPVRVMGVLLAVVAVCYTAATALLWIHSPAEWVIPIGLPLYYVFAGVLLTVERT